MAFPKRVLIEGEKLVLELRPHPIALARAVIVGVLVVIGWFVVLGNLPNNHALHQTIFWVAWIAGVFLLVWYTVRDVIRWATSYFVVTSDRVIHRVGLIAKHSMEIPLEAINDVRFSQNVLERLIKAGDIILESASEAGREEFKDIWNPEQVQKTIYEQGELNQQRMMKGGHPAATQAPAPASASVAGELEKLAELRSTGVISEEEFQAQKKKLLG